MMREEHRKMTRTLLFGGMFLVFTAAFWSLNLRQAYAGSGDCGFLGVYLGKDLDEGKGALIEAIVDNGPAEEAGLKGGDVIISFNGKDVEDIDHLRKMICKTNPGNKIAVVIEREGKKLDFSVEMGKSKMPKYVGWFDAGDAHKKALKYYCKAASNCDERGWLGIELQDLTEQLGEYFKVKDGEGALVSSVEKDSPAEKGSLKAGDVIVMLNGKDVDDSDEFIKLMGKTKPGDEATVNIIRSGKKKELKVTLGEVPAKHKCGDVCDCSIFSPDNWFDYGKQKRIIIKELSDLEDLENLEELKESLKDIEIDVNLPWLLKPEPMWNA